MGRPGRLVKLASVLSTLAVIATTFLATAPTALAWDNPTVNLNKCGEHVSRNLPFGGTFTIASDKASVQLIAFTDATHQPIDGHAMRTKFIGPGPLKANIDGHTFHVYSADCPKPAPVHNVSLPCGGVENRNLSPGGVGTPKWNNSAHTDLSLVFYNDSQKIETAGHATVVRWTTSAGPLTIQIGNNVTVKAASCPTPPPTITPPPPPPTPLYVKENFLPCGTDPTYKFDSRNGRPSIDWDSSSHQGLVLTIYWTPDRQAVTGKAERIHLFTKGDGCKIFETWGENPSRVSFEANDGLHNHDE